MTSLIFDDQTCEDIFGAEDAENEPKERFKQYFYYNKTYENINSPLPIRLLVGHKGVGKSALLKRAHLNDMENETLSIWMQPKTLRFQAENSNFVALIEEWKSHLLAQIGQEVLKALRVEASDKVSFPKEVSSWLDFLTQKIQTSIEEKFSGTTETLVKAFLEKKEVRVYIDDIDRGWSASPSDIRNISALLNAIRDLSGGDERRLKFRISLRSDVYFLVRTSDESTDKIERNVVWLSWNNEEVLKILAKRIETYFATDTTEEALNKLTQKQISQQILSKVIVPTFDGNGHWSNRSIHHILLSLTRKRPRDIVKLMHGAGKKAYSKSHSIIQSKDLEESFESYSNERLQDIINEYKSELPDIETLLLAMRPTKMERTTRENYFFTTDALITKIKNIQGQVSLRFQNGRPCTPKALIQFLYKIEFITARVDKDGFIQRKDFEQSRFLANEMVDFGYSWEIHPAYRWALQPQDIKKVLDSIQSHESD